MDRVDAAVVLIEGPPEGDGLIAFAGSAEMVPPVALLVHAKDAPERASFYPFAEYSPEWVAMRWAVGRGRPVRFIDLPVAARPEGEGDRVDPIGELAAAAGYEDGETWWNNLIEQGTHEAALFAGIEAAMTALREGHESGAREAAREAHMRLTIRAAMADSAGPVAVVVGAWHVPALRAGDAKADRALLKGLPKSDAVATWVPWTDTRLAAGSGYGAGVVSPGWYRHLWGALAGEALDRRGLSVAWVARAAALLRDEGLGASTASVIDAVRLAEGLAALRGLATPGLEELQGAVLAALCGGDTGPLRLIHARLVVGTRVGAIDPAVPLMPLLADLARAQKRLRLVPDAGVAEISLDLRSEAGLAKSTLLHRLALIGVQWGTVIDAGQSRGSFRERWRLSWVPELGVALVEALRWGTTIAQAAGGAAAERAAELDDVAALAELIRATLVADLGAVAEGCIGRLQAVAARSGEVGALMAAVVPLAKVLRYGTARAMPEGPLRQVVVGLVREVCVGLPVAVRQLDAEAAGVLVGRAGALERALPLLDDAGLVADWHRALGAVARDVATDGAAVLRGFAVRKLYDAGVMDEAATAGALSRALSAAVVPTEAAWWLEGFLDDAGRLLLHDARLLAVMDAWVMGLGAEALEELLPQLRRAFAGLDATERRRLREAVGRPVAAVGGVAEGPAFAAARPLLELILGLA